MQTSRSYHDELVESLRDPQEALAFLVEVVKEGTPEELGSALSDVLEAHPEMADKVESAKEPG